MPGVGKQREIGRIKKELDETGDSSLWKRIYLPAKATGGCTHGYWQE